MKNKIKNIIAVLAVFHPLFCKNSESLADEKNIEFCSDDFDTVHMDIDEGNVSIVPTKDVKTRINWSPMSSDSMCDVRAKVVDGVLKIECKKKYLGGQCNVHLTINAPSHKSFKVNAGSSNFKMDGITGKLNLNIGSGSVDLNSQLSEIKCNLGSASLSIVYSSLPQKRVPIKINGGCSRVNIKLPTNSVVYSKTNCSPFVVTVKNEFECASSANDSCINFDIHYDLGVGQINIKK
ncbi:MAG: hypothetical protein HEEMFOPI_00208 [Holosporales bacterium]